MKKGAKLFEGEHDFKSFCSAHTQAEETIRHIAAFSLFGAFLNGAKAASSDIRAHNGEVQMLSGDVYYGTDTKSLTSDMDFTAEAEFADEAALSLVEA